jgi:hypothetical protein
MKLRGQAKEATAPALPALVPNSPPIPSRKEWNYTNGSTRWQMQLTVGIGQSPRSRRAFKRARFLSMRDGGVIVQDSIAKPSTLQQI